MFVFPSAIVACLFVGAADEPDQFQTSAAIESDEEAWRQPGFRVSLAYALEGLSGTSGAPGGVLHTAALKVGVRIDPHWALFGTLRYGVRLGEFPMFRYSGTIDPTFSLDDDLTISLGFGIAGFVVPDTGEPTPAPSGGLIAPYTLPGPSPILGACDGVGVVASVRIEHAIILSDSMSTGPAIQIDGQYTGCTENLNQSNPDTADEITLRQFWTHAAVSITWLFNWR